MAKFDLQTFCTSSKLRYLKAEVSPQRGRALVTKYHGRLQSLPRMGHELYLCIVAGRMVYLENRSGSYFVITR